MLRARTVPSLPPVASRRPAKRCRKGREAERISAAPRASGPISVAALRAALLVLLAALPCASCATTVGTVAGPVTGPITFWRHTEGIAGWIKVLLVPVAVPVGPILGLTAGARADAGWVMHREYGIYPDPPFEIVFDPASTVLGRPGMDFSYGYDPHLDEHVERGSSAGR